MARAPIVGQYIGRVYTSIKARGLGLSKQIVRQRRIFLTNRARRVFFLKAMRVRCAASAVRAPRLGVRQIWYDLGPTPAWQCPEPSALRVMLRLSICFFLSKFTFFSSFLLFFTSFFT